jgi:hypothetical protein
VFTWAGARQPGGRWLGGGWAAVGRRLGQLAAHREAEEIELDADRAVGARQVAHGVVDAGEATLLLVPAEVRQR